MQEPFDECWTMSVPRVPVECLATMIAKDSCRMARAQAVQRLIMQRRKIPHSALHTVSEHKSMCDAISPVGALRPWGVACESLWRACESEGGTQRASSGEGGTQRAPSGRPFTRCPLGAIHPVERALCGSESGSRAFEGSSALTRCLTSGRWAPGASAVCTRGARATFCLYLCTVLYSIARYKKHPVKALKLWRGHATQGGSELPPPLPLGR
eukprot:scaffold48039_cov85-Phaeocystis_antarctica.AAC.1